MNLEKLNHLVSSLEPILAELKEEFLLGSLASEKIQIVTVWDDDLSYIHYWDPRNPAPRILFIEKGKAKEKAMTEQCCQALNMLNNRSYKYGVEWTGDYPVNQLPEMFQELVGLFKVEIKELSSNQKYYIKRGDDVIYYLQSKPEVSETSGDDLREDRVEGLPDLRPEIL